MLWIFCSFWGKRSQEKKKEKKREEEKEACHRDTFLPCLAAEAVYH